jgi:hypothetical protein
MWEGKIIRTAVFNGKNYAHFGIHEKTAFLYGSYKKEDIIALELSVHEDQSPPKETKNPNEPDYWGYWDFDRKSLTLIYPAYFLLDMCFPNGIRTCEEIKQGKAYRLKVENNEQNIHK